MSEPKPKGICGNCKKVIYDYDFMVVDSRTKREYCSTSCANEDVDNSGYSYRDYQSWKD
jgi:hypothetical protein